MLELTPKEIVGALRQCGKTSTCGGCPYQGRPGCRIELLTDTAALIEARELLDGSGDGWISVEERLPDQELARVRAEYGEQSVEVIVQVVGATLCTTLEYDGEGFKGDCGEPYRVFRWMPMPSI